MQSWLNKRTLIVGAAVVAALAALAWAFVPGPIEVETATVTRGRFEQVIEEDGRTHLMNRYAVSAPVAGRVARITLREGDRVNAGDPVGEVTPLMPALIDQRSEREARARLKGVEAGVDAPAARLARARVAQEEARVELLRTDRLAQDGFVSPSRLDSARLALAGARRETEAAAAQADAAGHDREQAAAALEPASAGRGGSPLRLRAPVTGVVLRVAQQSEATIAAGAVLLEIGDPGQLEVVAQLLTDDAVLARPGTRVVIDRWGGPPLEGRVRRVEPAAFTKVSALGIEEQRVNTLIDIVQAPPGWQRVGDGFRVTVRVLIGSQDDVLLAPAGAVFRQGDSGFATYRIEQGRARLRPVQVSGRGDSQVALKGGVDPGDQLVMYTPAGLSDGQRVRPLRR